MCMYPVGEGANRVRTTDMEQSLKHFGSGKNLTIPFEPVPDVIFLASYHSILPSMTRKEIEQKESKRTKSEGRIVNLSAMAW